MRGFLKLVFATVIGIFVSFFLLFIIGASLGSGSGSAKISSNSILKLKLVGDLPDLTVDDPFSEIDPLSGSFNTEPIVGLKDLKSVIEAAINDDKIKAIWLNTDELGAMPANAMELVRTLQKFKDSGKLIYAYSNNLSESSLIINSVADKSYLNPMGNVDFNGMASEIIYYTGLLEKAKVKPMIFYAGEFKSATEPFRLKSMSEENRLQVETYLNSIYSNFLDQLSSNRKISKDSLITLANNLDVFMAADAFKYKLVDGLKYEDEVETELKEKFGYKKDDPLKLVSYNKYKSSLDASKVDSKGNSKNKIAVIYAEGNIEDGDATTGVISGNHYRKLIKEAREDENVKAIVLRVNSPGGSAFASEQILRELELAQQKIPVVVSMGNLAASGGYYIASKANKIVAEPTTITGSIGVFGMVFDIHDALNGHLGLTFDRVKTNDYADFGSTLRPWTDKEKELLTKSVQQTYDIFLTHVSKGRKMSKEDVDKVARGRVWTGEDAKKLGLVDTLGNLQTAIEIAQNLAQIDNYQIKNLPESKSFSDMIIEKITGSKEESVDEALANVFGDEYYYIKQMSQLQKMQGVQARVPYAIRIK